MVFNNPLDDALINGVWIFPEMGIRGAGIATVYAWSLIALLYIGLLIGHDNERRYGMWSGRAFDADLFLRILKKGVPAALQFTGCFAFLLSPGAVANPAGNCWLRVSS
jgi:MATE family multidrug resistance protein